MKFNFKLISIFIFSFNTLVNECISQSIKEINLQKVDIDSLYSILKQNSTTGYDNVEWEFYDSIDSYKFKKNIELTNRPDVFKFLKNSNCYLSTIFYVDKKNNYINLNQGIHLCQEPPDGGTTTLYKLILKDITGKFFIFIYDEEKIENKFEITKIEYLDSEYEIPYKIYLHRKSP